MADEEKKFDGIPPFEYGCLYLNFSEGGVMLKYLGEVNEELEESIKAQLLDENNYVEMPEWQKGSRKRCLLSIGMYPIAVNTVMLHNSWTFNVHAKEIKYS